MKARRQSVILDAIQRAPVRSQEQLRRTMRAGEFDVTQATLSRDIRELGLVKGGADGAYHAPRQAQAGTNGPPRSTLGRGVAPYRTRVDRVQRLVALRTGRAEAHLRGVGRDSARLPRVAGRIAGGDPILAIAP